MYSLICDGIEIAKTAAGDIAINNGSIREKINSAAQVSFTLLPTNPYKDAVQLRKSEIIILHHGAEIFRGQMLEKTVDTYGFTEYTGLSDLSYLQDSWQAPFLFTGYGFELIQRILDIHNNKVKPPKRIYRGTVKKSGLGSSITYEIKTYRRTWDIISDLLNQYGGLVELRTGDDGLRYLDWVDDSNRFSTRLVRWGDNLAAIEVEEDCGDLITCLEAEGDDGMVVSVRDEEAILERGEIWGNAKFDAASMSDLIAQAEAYIEAHRNPARMVTASVVGDNSTDDPFHIADFNHVLSTRHSVDAWLPVTAINTDLTGKKRPQVTLGTNPAILTASNKAARNREWLRTLIGREPTRVYAIDLSGIRAQHNGVLATAKE